MLKRVRALPHMLVQWRLELLFVWELMEFRLALPLGRFTALRRSQQRDTPRPTPPHYYAFTHFSSPSCPPTLILILSPRLSLPPLVFSLLNPVSFSCFIFTIFSTFWLVLNFLSCYLCLLPFCLQLSKDCQHL